MAREVEEEFKAEGKDLKVDTIADHLKIRLFEEENNTEIILETEEGTAFVVYLSALMLDKVAQEKKPKSLDGIIFANEPIEDFFDEYGDQDILDLNINKKLLKHVEFD